MVLGARLQQSSKQLKVVPFLSVLLFTGCSAIDLEPAKNETPINDGMNVFEYRPSSYLREVSYEEILAKKKIRYSAIDAPLVDVLSTNLPNYNVVPGDLGVDMARSLEIAVNDMPVPEFIRYIENISGYGIDISGNTLTVSSRKTKQWNLAAISGSRDHNITVGQTINGISGDDDFDNENTSKAEVKIESKETDIWDEMIRGARAIVGAEHNEAPVTATDEDQVSDDTSKLKPYVIGVRPLGLVTASGAPKRMTLLDEYLSNIERASTIQVNINTKIFDVTLDDERAAGIEWSFNMGSREKFFFESVAGSATPSLVPDADGRAVFDWLTGWDNNIAANVEFLSEFGEVELVNQPNVTTLNGSTAYLSSGDEFSFISDFEVNQDDNGNVFVTPEFARIKIGVTLAVTPRVLGDDRILLDIVPIVSEFIAFREFPVQIDAGEQNIDVVVETPDITLQELATQVIARSGQTILLGGLITKRVTDAISRLPLKEGTWFSKLSDAFFKSVDNKFEKEELVIVMTPTLVEDSKWIHTRK